MSGKGKDSINDFFSETHLDEDGNEMEFLDKIILKTNQAKKELEQKPKTSLLAFKMKSKNVALRADSLSLSVPSEFNIPQVRSRLVTLKTKLNALEMYLNLNEIPEKKVISLITEVNSEIKGVYGQWNEIIIKKAIPREIGEDEMIKALDTSRFANSKFLEESMSKSELEKRK